jgi:restriction system protein
MEWDDENTSPDAKDIAIGWHEIGDLRRLGSSRDAFKAAFTKVFPSEKSGAIPVKAGVLYRFFKDIRVGDLIVYPSKADRMINVGVVTSDYLFLPEVNIEYPHRRRVEWRLHAPRAQFSQKALYEIGSAVTLFQVTNNADEFLAATEWVASRAA